MELSTIMPTPIVMPPRLIMFSVSPPAFIIRNTDTIHIGIATEMTAVEPKLRRNTSSTSAARITPYTIFDIAWSTERLM